MNKEQKTAREAALRVVAAYGVPLEMVAPEYLKGHLETVEEQRPDPNLRRGQIPIQSSLHRGAIEFVVEGRLIRVSGIQASGVSHMSVSDEGAAS